MIRVNDAPQFVKYWYWWKVTTLFSKNSWQRRTQFRMLINEKRLDHSFHRLFSFLSAFAHVSDRHVCDICGYSFSTVNFEISIQRTMELWTTIATGPKPLNHWTNDRWFVIGKPWTSEPLNLLIGYHIVLLICGEQKLLSSYLSFG